MAQATIWILSTCIPGDTQPCWPQAFGTEAAAQAAFLEAMQSEWSANCRRDDAGNVLPFPTTDDGRPDPEKAHSIMAEDDPDDWGLWEITAVPVDLPEPEPRAT